MDTPGLSLLEGNTPSLLPSWNHYSSKSKAKDKHTFQILQSGKDKCGHGELIAKREDVWDQMLAASPTVSVDCGELSAVSSALDLEGKLQLAAPQHGTGIADSR